MPSSPEQDKYNRRIAACPIHKWANVDDYLRRAEVPQQYWRPFHELVLARGEVPKQISTKQGKEFGKKAVEIISKLKVKPEEEDSLNMMFSQLIGQWISSGAKNN